VSDYTKDPHVTLVCGAQKSGKSSFAFSLLLNSPSACNFIFDDRGQAQKRLGLTPSGTERECELALQTRTVCFNPYRMFKPTELPDAFRWFCHWALQTSKRGEGRKILFVDEAWQVMDSRTAPDELVNVARTGRWEDLQLMMATHRPSDYPTEIRALVTEWICFNTKDPLDLEKVRPYFPDVDQCAQLQRGQFISYDREAGSILRGQFDPATGFFHAVE
jgi:hypothetical protein